MSNMGLMIAAATMAMGGTSDFSNFKLPPFRSGGGRQKGPSMPSLDYGSGDLRKYRRRYVRKAIGEQKRRDANKNHRSRPIVKKVRLNREQRIIASRKHNEELKKRALK